VVRDVGLVWLAGLLGSWEAGKLGWRGYVYNYRYRKLDMLYIERVFTRTITTTATVRIQ
jgi:hypothetical protein